MNLQDLLTEINTLKKGKVITRSEAKALKQMTAIAGVVKLLAGNKQQPTKPAPGKAGEYIEYEEIK